jgi:hypothetical protein
MTVSRVGWGVFVDAVKRALAGTNGDIISPARGGPEQVRCAAFARTPLGLQYLLALLAVLACGGCGGSETVEPAPCYQRSSLGNAELCELLGDACDAASTPAPALSEAVTVVPDAEAMPAGVVSQAAHNNLDVVWHRGRLFFAFRTAPNHFADERVVLYVVSTTDQKHWQLEARFALGKDLREPRFLTLGDRLLLYFARLGEVPLTFAPEAMLVSEQRDGCLWTEPREIAPTGDRDFIPWRAREIDGTGYLMGYAGGADIYELDSGGIRVHWLKTHDGETFEPAAGDDSVVLEGGSSETDWAFLDDGSLVAISRNESGDELGWGSKICTAPADALGDWSCEADPKKYDSPLVFSHQGSVYLIGRRQLINDGKYDLDMRELSPADQTLEYQKAYWGSAKRCALWRIDPGTRTVEWMLDLPSNGDTCFASAVALGDGRFLVYNYTSPLDDPDLSWRDGQFGETSIYRLTLTVP